MQTNNIDPNFATTDSSWQRPELTVNPYFSREDWFSMSPEGLHSDNNKRRESRESSENSEQPNHYTEKLSLHGLARERFLEIAQNLAHVNYGDTVACTEQCVLYALAQNRVDILERALERGLDPKTKFYTPTRTDYNNLFFDFYGGDIAGLSMIFKNKEALNLLSHYGWNIENNIEYAQSRSNKKNYLVLAMEHNDYGLFDTLLKCGSSLEAVGGVRYNILELVLTNPNRDKFFSIIENNISEPHYLINLLMGPGREMPGWTPLASCVLAEADIIRYSSQEPETVGSKSISHTDLPLTNYIIETYGTVENLNVFQDSLAFAKQTIEDCEPEEIVVIGSLGAMVDYTGVLLEKLLLQDNLLGPKDLKEPNKANNLKNEYLNSTTKNNDKYNKDKVLDPIPGTIKRSVIKL